MSALPIWSAIAPAIASALASAAPAANAHAATAPQPGAADTIWANPLLIGVGLAAIGVVCALVMLMAAVLSTRTPPRWRMRRRHAGLKRGTRRLPRRTQRTGMVGREGIFDMTLDAEPAQQQDEPIDGDAEAWRPLSEDIPGVGRIEWDPQILRAFAGQPEVLYRLAFHRWRYQQGSFSEFEPAGASSHEGRSATERPRPLSKYVPSSNEEDCETRRPHESSRMPRGASS